MMTHPMTIADIEREAPLSALDIDVANASIRRLKIALLTTEQENERLRATLHGETEGEQLHAILTIGGSRLKIVWRTQLWFQVTDWVRGLSGLVTLAVTEPK
mgnify:CR=1 FL=1